MAKQFLDFKKVVSMPSTPYVKGTVYFDDSDHIIKVAISDSSYKRYGGVQDVNWNASLNTLTITKIDGSPLAIDFSTCITETELAVILDDLRSGIGFEPSTNRYGGAAGTGIADTSYLATSDASTVVGALRILDSKLNQVEHAAGVVSIGGQSGEITLKGGGANNGDINLTMNGQQLQADIVGLGTAAYTNSSAYDTSGAAAAVLGTSGDASTVKTVYGLNAKIDAVKADSSVSVIEAAGTGDVLKTYTIKQGDISVGTINIPKDFLVKDASLKTVTVDDQPYSGARVGDKYIDFVINTEDTSSGSSTDSHIYLPVKDLVDVYTGTSTATIDVSVNSNREISASIRTGSVTTEMLDSSVQTALGKANSAIQSVTGETAVADSSYISISVSASTNGDAVTLSSNANVTMQDVSTSTTSVDGLATAYNVQQYVQTYVAEQLMWSDFND